MTEQAKMLRHLDEHLAKETEAITLGWADYRKLSDPNTPLTALPKDQLPTAHQVRRSLVVAYLAMARQCIIYDPEARTTSITVRGVDNDLANDVMEELHKKGYTCTLHGNVIQLSW